MADFQPRFDRRGLAAEDHQGYPVGVYIPDDNPLVGIVTCHCPGVGMDFERTQEQPVDKLEDAARDTYPVYVLDVPNHTRRAGYRSQCAWAPCAVSARFRHRCG